MNIKDLHTLGVRVVPLLLLATVVAVLLLYNTFGGVTFAEYAERVIAVCSDEGYRPTCYDKEIPKLLEELSMEDVFEVTRVVQSLDTSYGYCHVLGHELGAREVAQDPSKWMEVAAQCPSDGMCSNGCLHGALITRFSEGEWSLTEDQIKDALPDLSVACEPREGFNPSGLDKGQCYHGLGHLTMFMTHAAIPRSLAICDQISLKEDGADYRNVCYEGIFMQLFQPLEPEDEALIEDIVVTKQNLRPFCDSFETERQRISCYIEGWPVFREEVATPLGLMDYCMLQKSEVGQNRCFSMLFHTAGQGANFEIAAIETFCNGIPLSQRGKCFGNSAMAMIQADPKFIDPAVRLCGSVQDEMSRDSCFGELSWYARYRFHRDSNEFAALCGELPGSWQERCNGPRKL